MIRVMNVISDTNIGGAGRVLVNYLKYYDKDRFTVSVALPKGSDLMGPLGELGCRLIEVDGMADKSLDLSAIKTLREVIRREDPDIVHTHGSMSGRIAARQEGKVVIYTRHSAFPVKGYMKRGPGRLANKLINEHYADRIIAVSPAAAENLTDGGISPAKIDVMMNGVDPVARLSGEETARQRAAWGLQPEDFVTGILARIEDYKGHEDILEALAILKGRGKRAKLLIAGAGNHEGAVRAKTQALGLGEDVRFLGFLNNVAGFLSVLDLQLNASWGTETSSLSILEGFSMGLPAVVSDYGGNPCLVDEGVNGFLFPTRDARALADCLEKVMDLPDGGKALGEGARRIYEERFTGQRFAQNIEEIYTKVWEEKKHGKGR